MMVKLPMNFGITVNCLSPISERLVAACLCSSLLTIRKYIIVPSHAHLLGMLLIQRHTTSGINPPITFLTLFMCPLLNHSKLQFLLFHCLSTSQQIHPQKHSPPQYKRIVLSFILDPYNRPLIFSLKLLPSLFSSQNF